jgi:outer membrane receptor for ferrienterochelin and colicins
MMKGVFSGLAFFCMTLSGWAVEAQPAPTKTVEPTEISLEGLLSMEIPIVEGASKYKQKITEAPASVTVITADEIKKYGHRTLADVLRSVPGLYVSYDRSNARLGVRGVISRDYNSRILLLVDGHRINNSLSDGAPIGTEFILDVDLIERVEVIRGPGSSLYGNNAFFGVINVITRKGGDMSGNGFEVSGEGGSYDTYKGRVTYGKKYKNGLEVLVSGSVYDSGGQDQLYYSKFDQRSSADYRASNNGIAQSSDSDAYRSFFGDVSFHDLSVEGAIIEREKKNPTAASYADFNDQRLRTTDDRSYANITYAHQFPDIVDVKAQLYYDRQEFNQTLSYVNQGGGYYREAETGEWWGGEVQLTKHFWERLTLTLGGEYRDDFRQQLDLLDAVTGDKIGDSTRTNRQNYGIYLEGDLAVLTNLHLNAGFRYDQYGDFDPAFNPRVALIYNPFAQSTFKAIYGSAFRAPNIYELRRNPSSTDTTPDPETVRTYELLYEQGIGDHLRSSVGGFYNQIDDLITFKDQHYVNVKGAESKGLELALETSWASGIRGRASYTFQRTRDTSTKEVLIDSPEHLGKINLSVPLWKNKVFGSVEFQYASKRTSVYQDSSGNLVSGIDASGYGLVNLTLFSQNLAPGLELSATVYNLLDRRYSDPSSAFHQQDLIEQDGRSLRVKMTYRF